LNICIKPQAVRILEEVVGKLPNFKVAQRHLDRAQNYLKTKIKKEAILKIVKIKTWILQDFLDKAHTEIMDTLENFENIDEDDNTLRSECDKLLEEVNKKEQIKRNVTKTVESVKKAIEESDFEAAKTEINALDVKAQEHPEIRKLHIRLTKIQDIDDALEKAQQSFDDGNLQSAHDQIGVLKGRVNNNKHILHLYNEIESAFSYQQGEDAFNHRRFAEAKKAFQKIIKLDTLYQEEAIEKLETIEKLKETDKKVRYDYKKALQYKEAQKFEEAYSILVTIEDTLTTIKDQVISLRNEVRQKWRRQLVKQIQENLKMNAFDQVFQLSEKLENIKRTEDSKFIYEARKKYHIHMAQNASSSREWEEALHHWQEAQNYNADDPSILKGLQETKIFEALNRADTTEDEYEAITILEKVLDYQNIDPTVESRLRHLYFLSEEYSKIMHLLELKTDLKSKYRTRTRKEKNLLTELRESKEKFNSGAYNASIEILDNCLRKYSEYHDMISELLQRRKQNIIDTLFKEAKESKNKGESVVYILPKYQEILSIEPDHREAKRCNVTLLEKFKNYISELIHECIQMENDENTLLEDIEGKIAEIEIINARKIASDQQSVKIRPHLERLFVKRRSLLTLQKKQMQIRGLLNEAKVDGDFNEVDRVISDVISITSTRNIKFNNLIKEIKEIKKCRNQVVTFTNQILDAYNKHEYSTIERLSDDLTRIDPDDDFSIQNKQLQLVDTFSNQELGFKDLKAWAQQRRQNLQRLTAWFDENQIQTEIDTLKQEESQLRENNKKEYDSIVFVKNLEKLSNDYKNRCERLVSPPEPTLSERGENIIKRAEDFRKNMLKKSNNLNVEIISITQNEKLVKELSEKAGNLIDTRKYEEAKPFVEKGLTILPAHKLLLHYNELIQDELK
jgi:hypothetical protein